MSAEPISTRIARLRGCAPVHVPGGALTREQWRCQCRQGHGPIPSLAALWTDLGFDAWTEPAASFALLAEMVDAEDPASELGRGFGGYWADQAIRNARTGVPLGEAIALAYEAYATAKAVRQ